MGLISFIQGVGKKIFGKEAAAATPEAEPLKAQALMDHIKSLGIPFNKLTIKVQGDKVILEGETKTQADAEKIALNTGNIEGVASVENNLKVASPEPESTFHTVEKGDTLWAISEKYYGDGSKYPTIVGANQPMIKDADEIYPGQVLRIPSKS